MKTSSKIPDDKKADPAGSRLDVKGAVADGIRLVSERTGLKESSVRAGLLFVAGLAAGLLLRSRR